MVYRIANWNENFENNRTRDLKNMAWVPVPNKHDGDGFTDLITRPNGAALYGGWMLILQVASKCDPRGTLLRDGGKPHDSASIARITRASEVDIKAALLAAVEVGWLESQDDDVKQIKKNPAPSCGENGSKPHPPDVHPAPSCVPHARAQNGTEQKGKNRKEQNGTEGNGKKATTVSLRENSTSVFTAVLNDGRVGTILNKIWKGKELSVEQLVDAWQSRLKYEKPSEEQVIDFLALCYESNDKRSSTAEAYVIGMMRKGFNPSDESVIAVGRMLNDKTS